MLIKQDLFNALNKETFLNALNKWEFTYTESLNLYLGKTKEDKYIAIRFVEYKDLTIDDIGAMYSDSSDYASFTIVLEADDFDTTTIASVKELMNKKNEGEGHVPFFIYLLMKKNNTLLAYNVFGDNNMPIAKISDTPRKVFISFTAGGSLNPKYEDPNKYPLSNLFKPFEKRTRTILAVVSGILVAVSIILGFISVSNLTSGIDATKVFVSSSLFLLARILFVAGLIVGVIADKEQLTVIDIACTLIYVALQFIGLAITSVEVMLYIYLGTTIVMTAGLLTLLLWKHIISPLASFIILLSAVSVAILLEGLPYIISGFGFTLSLIFFGIFVVLTILYFFLHKNGKNSVANFIKRDKITKTRLNLVRVLSVLLVSFYLSCSIGGMLRAIEYSTGSRGDETSYNGYITDSFYLESTSTVIANTPNGVLVVTGSISGEGYYFIIKIPSINRYVYSLVSTNQYDIYKNQKYTPYVINLKQGYLGTIFVATFTGHAA